MLVIFMIAAPVFSRPIPLDIGVSHSIQPPKLAPIELRIDASGQVFFNQEPAPLTALFSAEAVRAGETLPGVRISANGDADYQVVAKVLATAQNAGFTKIGFTR
jgi:biopolymer transport protein ExbD